MTDTPAPPSDPDPPPESLGAAVGRAVRGPGTVTVEGEQGTAEVEVSEAGPVGVRVRGVRVRPAHPAPLGHRARHLADRLRPGGERLRAVEVDEGLGGATLRTDPADIRGRRYFEVSVDPEGAAVRRHRVGEDGQREADDFALTRDGLERMVDDLAAEPPESAPPPHPLRALLDE